MASATDVTAQIAALREVSESLLLTQKEMSRDIGDMASAVTELTTASENLVNGLHSVKLLELAVTQLGETVTAYTGKLGALFDEQRETSERLGRYLQDAAKQQSGIRQVEARLRVLEGGQVGER